MTAIKENADVKAFIRLLKELEIYKLWLSNRTNYLKLVGCYPEAVRNYMFACVLGGASFRDIIDNSFGWSTTNCEKLWINLYETIQTAYTPSQILRDCCKGNLNLINPIKNEIEEYFKRH